MCVGAPASRPGRGARHGAARPARLRPAGRDRALDWLATPTQRLAELAGGAVFHDGLGELAPARASLAWYPRDFWCYVLACQWQRLSQEEAFPGRCAEAGDELGSVVVTAGWPGT
jgi:hypothetical protein